MTQPPETEPHPLREKCPPQRLAPAEAVAFSLVLLAIRNADGCLPVDVLQGVLGIPETGARESLGRPMPFALKTGLSYQDAIRLQDELITFDVVTVFVRDEVAAGGDPGYLRQLYSDLLTGPEFELVPVYVASVPATHEGAEFRRRFPGREKYQLAMGKKARVMERWAARIGGQVLVLQ